MVKHTPGPWHYRRDTNPGEILNNDFEIIAVILDPADEHAQPTETEVANAHLLAAAPEMLEALKIDEAFQTMGYTQKAVNWLAAQGIEVPVIVPLAGIDLMVFQKQARRAAIAKAEGR